MSATASPSKPAAPSPAPTTPTAPTAPEEIFYGHIDVSDPTLDEESNPLHIFVIDQPKLTIGRDVSNDLRFNHLKVSRHHYEISFKKDDESRTIATLTNLSERSTINKRKIAAGESVILNHNDEISIINYNLRWREYDPQNPTGQIDQTRPRKSGRISVNKVDDKEGIGPVTGKRKSSSSKSLSGSSSHHKLLQAKRRRIDSDMRKAVLKKELKAMNNSKKGLINGSGSGVVANKSTSNTETIVEKVDNDNDNCDDNDEQENDENSNSNKLALEAEKEKEKESKNEALDNNTIVDEVEDLELDKTETKLSESNLTLRQLSTSSVSDLDNSLDNSSASLGLENHENYTQEDSNSNKLALEAEEEEVKEKESQDNTIVDEDKDSELDKTDFSESNLRQLSASSVPDLDNSLDNSSASLLGLESMSNINSISLMQDDIVGPESEIETSTFRKSVSKKNDFDNSSPSTNDNDNDKVLDDQEQELVNENENEEAVEKEIEKNAHHNILIADKVEENVIVPIDPIPLVDEDNVKVEHEHKTSNVRKCVLSQSSNDFDEVIDEVEVEKEEKDNYSLDNDNDNRIFSENNSIQLSTLNNSSSLDLESSVISLIGFGLEDSSSKNLPINNEDNMNEDNMEEQEIETPTPAPLKSTENSVVIEEDDDEKSTQPDPDTTGDKVILDDQEKECVNEVVGVEKEHKEIDNIADIDEEVVLSVTFTEEDIEESVLETSTTLRKSPRKSKIMPPSTPEKDGEEVIVSIEKDTVDTPALETISRKSPRKSKIMPSSTPEKEEEEIVVSKVIEIDTPVHETSSTSRKSPRKSKIMPPSTPEKDDEEVIVSIEKDTVDTPLLETTTTSIKSPRKSKIIPLSSPIRKSMRNNVLSQSTYDYDSLALAGVIDKSDVLPEENKNENEEEDNYSLDNDPSIFSENTSIQLSTSVNSSLEPSSVISLIGLENFPKRNSTINNDEDGNTEEQEIDTPTPAPMPMRKSSLKQINTSQSTNDKKVVLELLEDVDEEVVGQEIEKNENNVEGDKEDEEVVDSVTFTEEDIEESVLETSTSSRKSPRKSKIMPPSTPEKDEEVIVSTEKDTVGTPLLETSPTLRKSSRKSKIMEPLSPEKVEEVIVLKDIEESVLETSKTLRKSARISKIMPPSTPEKDEEKVIVTKDTPVLETSTTLRKRAKKSKIIYPPSSRKSLRISVLSQNQSTTTTTTNDSLALARVTDKDVLPEENEVAEQEEDNDPSIFSENNSIQLSTSVNSSLDSSSVISLIGLENFPKRNLTINNDGDGNMEEQEIETPTPAPLKSTENSVVIEVVDDDEKSTQPDPDTTGEKVILDDQEQEFVNEVVGVEKEHQEIDNIADIDEEVVLSVTFTEEDIEESVHETSRTLRKSPRKSKILPPSTPEKVEEEVIISIEKDTVDTPVLEISTTSRKSPRKSKIMEPLSPEKVEEVVVSIEKDTVDEPAHKTSKTSRKSPRKSKITVDEPVLETPTTLRKSARQSKIMAPSTPEKDDEVIVSIEKDTVDTPVLEISTTSRKSARKSKITPLSTEKDEEEVVVSKVTETSITSRKRAKKSKIIYPPSSRKSLRISVLSQNQSTTTTTNDSLALAGIIDKDVLLLPEEKVEEVIVSKDIDTPVLETSTTSRKSAKKSKIMPPSTPEKNDEEVLVSIEKDTVDTPLLETPTTSRKSPRKSKIMPLSTEKDEEEVVVSKVTETSTTSRKRAKKSKIIYPPSSRKSLRISVLSQNQSTTTTTNDSLALARVIDKDVLLLPEEKVEEVIVSKDIDTPVLETSTTSRKSAKKSKIMPPSTPVLEATTTSIKSPRTSPETPEKVDEEVLVSIEKDTVDTPLLETSTTSRKRAKKSKIIYPPSSRKSLRISVLSQNQSTTTNDSLAGVIDKDVLPQPEENEVAEQEEANYSFDNQNVKFSENKSIQMSSSVNSSLDSSSVISLIGLENSSNKSLTSTDTDKNMEKRIETSRPVPAPMKKTYELRHKKNHLSQSQSVSANDNDRKVVLDLLKDVNDHTTDEKEIVKNDKDKEEVVTLISIPLLDPVDEKSGASTRRKSMRKSGPIKAATSQLLKEDLKQLDTSKVVDSKMELSIVTPTVQLRNRTPKYNQNLTETEEGKDKINSEVIEEPEVKRRRVAVRKETATSVGQNPSKSKEKGNVSTNEKVVQEFEPKRMTRSCKIVQDNIKKVEETDEKSKVQNKKMMVGKEIEDLEKKNETVAEKEPPPKEKLEETIPVKELEGRKLIEVVTIGDSYYYYDEPISKRTRGNETNEKEKPEVEVEPKRETKKTTKIVDDKKVEEAGTSNSKVQKKNKVEKAETKEDLEVGPSTLKRITRARGNIIKEIIVPTSFSSKVVQVIEQVSEKDQDQPKEPAKEKGKVSEKAQEAQEVEPKRKAKNLKNDDHQKDPKSPSKVHEKKNEEKEIVPPPSAASKEQEKKSTIEKEAEAEAEVEIPKEIKKRGRGGPKKSAPAVVPIVVEEPIVEEPKLKETTTTRKRGGPRNESIVEEIVQGQGIKKSEVVEEPQEKRSRGGTPTEEAGPVPVAEQSNEKVTKNKVVIKEKNVKKPEKVVQVGQVGPRLTRKAAFDKKIKTRSLTFKKSKL